MVSFPVEEISSHEYSYSKDESFIVIPAQNKVPTKDMGQSFNDTYKSGDMFSEQDKSKSFQRSSLDQKRFWYSSIPPTVNHLVSPLGLHISARSQDMFAESTDTFAKSQDTFAEIDQTLQSDQAQKSLISDYENLPFVDESICPIIESPFTSCLSNTTYDDDNNFETAQISNPTQDDFVGMPHLEPIQSFVQSPRTRKSKSKSANKQSEEQQAPSNETTEEIATNTTDSESHEEENSSEEIQTKLTHEKSFSFNLYTRKLLKQIHQRAQISKDVALIVDNLLQKQMQGIIEEANGLRKKVGRKTLTTEDIQAAIILRFPRKLAIYADKAGLAAVRSFEKSKRQGKVDEDENNNHENSTDANKSSKTTKKIQAKRAKAITSMVEKMAEMKKSRKTKK